MMRLRATPILAFFALSPACSEPLAPTRHDARWPGPSSEPRSVEREPFELLKNAKQFQSSQIGYAGQPSVYSAAWRTLAKGPNAAAAFDSLYRAAMTPEARLYALVGLAATDQATALARMSGAEWKNAEVRTMFGCIVQTVPAADLLAEIRDGKWDWWVWEPGSPAT